MIDFIAIEPERKFFAGQIVRSCYCGVHVIRLERMNPLYPEASASNERRVSVFTRRSNASAV